MKNNAPQIKYPRDFEPPGPAAQADYTIECMEYFLDDHEEEYSSGPNTGLEPEEWVEFRSFYASIHWMYCQLVGEEVDSTKN